MKINKGCIGVRDKVFIVVLLSLCGFLPFFWSCDKPPESPPKPVIITKKIAMPDQEAKADKPVIPSEQQAAYPPKEAPKIEEKKPALPPTTPSSDSVVVSKKITSPEETPKKAEPAKPEKEAKPPVQATDTSKALPPVPARQPEISPKSEKEDVKIAQAQPKPETAAKAKSEEKAEKPQEAKTAEAPIVKEQPPDAKIVAFIPGGDYSAKGKIDPFAPLFKDEPVKEVKTKGEKGPERERRTPLEKVDLSQLKLVGIVRAQSGNKALVEEASGKGYIISAGTFIGIHYGKVSDILKDRVVVEEEDEDALGKITMRKRELKLQKPPGEDEYHDL